MDEIDDFDEPIFDENVYEDNCYDLSMMTERKGDDRRGPTMIKSKLASQLLAIRSKQLQIGAQPRVDPIPGESITSIAKRELISLVMPLSVIRIFPNGFYEIRPVREFDRIMRF